MIYGDPKDAKRRQAIMQVAMAMQPPQNAGQGMMALGQAIGNRLDQRQSQQPLNLLQKPGMFGAVKNYFATRFGGLF